MAEKVTAWFYHLDRPENGPRPMYESLERVWHKAEHWDWLIIFEATVDEINAAERLGRQVTYEEYAKDMDDADLPEKGLGGIMVDGLHVPEHGLYGLRRNQMVWGTRRKKTE